MVRRKTGVLTAPCQIRVSRRARVVMGIPQDINLSSAATFLSCTTSADPTINCAANYSTWEDGFLDEASDLPPATVTASEAEDTSDSVTSDSDTESSGASDTEESSGASDDTEETEEVFVNPWLGQRIRICSGDSLNQLPLNANLQETATAEEIEITLDKVPAHQAKDRLFADECDVAMVSIMDFFDHPEFYICSDSCVASEGLVRSALMYGRCQPNQIKSIAVSETSKTCSVMAQILLTELYGINPKLIPLESVSKWFETDVDAVILEGASALEPPPRGRKFAFVWDLGQRWTNWTGVPFVHSIWLAKDKNLSKLIAPVLSKSRDWGVEHMADQIVPHIEAVYGMESGVYQDYLQNKLVFRLGGRQRKGIEIFSRLAKKHGFIDLGAPIPFSHHLRFRPVKKDPPETEGE